MAFNLQSNTVYELRILGASNLQDVENVMFLYSSPNIPDPPAGISSFQALDIMRTRLRVNIWPLLGATYRMRELTLKKVTAVNLVTPPAPRRPYYQIVYGFEDFLPGEGVDTGGQAGDELPLYAAVAVRKKGSTDLGKVVDGATRWGPILESYTQPGAACNELTALSLVAWQAASDAWLAQIQFIGPGGPALNHGTLSRKAASAPGGAPFTSIAPNTIKQVRKLVTSQVSRKVRERFT